MPTKLSVIDLAPALTGEEGADKVARDLRHAAETLGFFYIVNHGVPEELMNGVYSHLKTFFDLPLETKMDTHVSKVNGGVRGYIGLYEQGNYGLDSTDRRDAAPESDLMDAKEVFTMGHVLDPGHASYHPLLYAPNQWPAHDPAFPTIIESYYAEMEKLSQRVFALFARALSLDPTYFADLTTDTPLTSMNCLHYPPMPANTSPGQMGIGEHTDFECFTLLSTDDVPGLQILDAAGEWIDVAPLPKGFIVNIGDMMARWSNDVFKSTIHRARNRSDRHRYAVAFFCGCNFDTELTSLVKDSVAKYPPVRAGDHMLARVGAANAATVSGAK